MKKWINEEYNKIVSRKATQGRLYLSPLTSRKPLQINYNQPHPTPPTRPALPDEVSIIKTNRNLRHTLDTPMSEEAQRPTKKQTGWNPCFPSVSGILPVAATCDICVIAFKWPNKFIALIRRAYISRWLRLSLCRSIAVVLQWRISRTLHCYFLKTYIPLLPRWEIPTDAKKLIFGWRIYLKTLISSY